MENDNYRDTFKQGVETVSTPNVFSQNLGQTGAYSNYGYGNYIDERREFIREDVNKEEDEISPDTNRNYMNNK